MFQENVHKNSKCNICQVNTQKLLLLTGHHVQYCYFDSLWRVLYMQFMLSCIIIPRSFMRFLVTKIYSTLCTMFQFEKHPHIQESRHLCCTYQQHLPQHLTLEYQIYVESLSDSDDIIRIKIGSQIKMLWHNQFYVSNVCAYQCQDVTWLLVQVHTGDYHLRELRS